jgi:hypothetical protein
MYFLFAGLDMIAIVYALGLAGATVWLYRRPNPKRFHVAMTGLGFVWLMLAFFASVVYSTAHGFQDPAVYALLPAFVLMAVGLTGLVKGGMYGRR